MAEFHGLRKHRLYNIWSKAKDRCFNPKCKSYNQYGGRGIYMCEEWRNSFLNFYKWAINNGYSDELSFDRQNVDGHYQPENCRWVAPHQQNYNQRKSINITYNGETLPLKVWAKKLNINYGTLHSRYKYYDFDVERLFEEVEKGKGQKRRVMIYDKQDNPLMIVESKSLASKVTNCDDSAIWRQMTGAYNHTGGFKFKYI